LPAIFKIYHNALTIKCEPTVSWVNQPLKKDRVIRIFYFDKLEQG